MDLVAVLIERGVDVLNPILSPHRMDPLRLMRLRRCLCFHGGMYLEGILPFGTVEEVRAHVRGVIDLLAPSRGYEFKGRMTSRGSRQGIR
jgi:uroporphyrinogen decarboxylase